jgi:hypothetical protein
MEMSTFWRLHLVLAPYLCAGIDWRKSPKNGRIHSSIHLGAALRYFAGACPIDIALVFGKSHVEVFESIWKVVDAINACPSLNITYPMSNHHQKHIAHEFELKSGAKFANCAGAIDGILI